MYIYDVSILAREINVVSIVLLNIYTWISDLFCLPLQYNNENVFDLLLLLLL